jgi:2-polyprenyl-3-methyl-5-hydroxy-6-metoxy-1,4-benzoquinol methylase
MEALEQSDPTGFETLEALSKADALNQWLYDKIKGFANGQILEIGSGIGNISAHLLKNQPTVTLTDLRPEYCRLLETKFAGHPHLQGIYEMDLVLPDFSVKNSALLGKFDTVIALNVVEHIELDRLAIHNASQLLRKNGRVVILVPAGPWLYNSLDRELGHFKRYTKSGLNNLLESEGFRVQDSLYFNAAAIAGWWISGHMLREKIITSTKLNLYNRLVPLFRIADWFITPFTGVSVISVGVKDVN